MKHPSIIQGGMGVAVSDWRLANAVARTGQLGVVSGTGINAVFVRRLQDGDPGGHLRRAISHFPVPDIADRLYSRYYIAGGKAGDRPYDAIPIASPTMPVPQQELIVLANFAEVWLAREGHQGLVGINLLEKIQFPNVHALYGAMLAGVDYVLMGAGIPREIPGVLDRLARHQPASIRLAVEGAAAGEEHRTGFSPLELMGRPLPVLKRPLFIAIIASNVLATTLVRKATGRVDGFVIEEHSAGGHNAPPRGGLQLTQQGEPIWGPRDVVDLDKIRELDLPFWLAGRQASPEALAAARAAGAVGIQAGTLFAFCEESGIEAHLKREVIDAAMRGECEVFTDPHASPTGFPFKVVRLPGTLSEDDEYAHRPRVCDLGFLRQPYRREDGSLGFRCASEPPELFLSKGGAPESTPGRKCLCNALMANVGHGQIRPGGYHEQPLLTAGEDLPRIARFVSASKPSYAAREVIDYLLEKQELA